MSDVPLNEPIEIRAGDTWQWRRQDLTQYPASTWTLKYRFKHPTATGIEVTATADGDAFAVTVSAATTSALNTTAAKVTFSWLAWVEAGSEKFTVDAGTIDVLPDLRTGTAGATLDARSDARKMYEGLVALQASYNASGGQGMIQGYSIAGRSMTFRNGDELLRTMAYWKGQVDAEDAANRRAAGLASGSGLKVRLG